MARTEEMKRESSYRDVAPNPDMVECRCKYTAPSSRRPYARHAAVHRRTALDPERSEQILMRSDHAASSNRTTMNGSAVTEYDLWSTTQAGRYLDRLFPCRKRRETVAMTDPS